MPVTPLPALEHDFLEGALETVRPSRLPIFHYSDGWQLVINTGTTIVTFLMVFLIQQSQNKDSVALHLRLNELIASDRAASNGMIGIEDASEEELRRLAAAYLRLSGAGTGDQADTVGPTESA